jgi:hypothetical protein
MKEINEIRDDEIRVIGEEKPAKPQGWKWLLLLLAGIVIGIIIWQIWPSKPEPPIDDPTEPGVFEPMTEVIEQPTVKLPLAKAEETGRAFIEMADTTINDIPIRLYLPHQVTLSLHLGAIDRDDTDIIFTAQAADIRADNGGIVGAFVLKGEPKAWGLSKKGYCAIINDTVTVGVADNSPLFEEATEKGGYFFRQFPLVDNGSLVENELKGKAVRRALCDRDGEIFTVETLSIESFHDFAQALVDLGVDNAIYLVGANAYGWATDANSQRHEFGDPNTKTSKKWRNINYLVMRGKP